LPICIFYLPSKAFKVKSKLPDDILDGFVEPKCSSFSYGGISINVEEHFLSLSHGNCRVAYQAKEEQCPAQSLQSFLMNEKLKVE